MTEREALKLALEAIEHLSHNARKAGVEMGLAFVVADEAITAVKEALAQPEQEPAARLHITETDTYPDVEVEVLNGATLQPSMSPVNVYTTPQQRKPLTGGDERRHIICLCPDCTKPAQSEQEPMTEDEIQQMGYQFKAAQTLGQSFYAVVRATELFHGIRKE